MSKYDIAAYIWPAYGSKEGRARIFWPQGKGEWETVREATARYDGHQWPRKPLWGYVDEADASVMEMEIEEAVSHGVNVFIYDWYWYDDRPYLEQCLNEGFLKAKNHNKMKFYLMWANHDVTYGWDRRISIFDYDTVVWQGAVNEEIYRKIAKRWVEKYFLLDEYYKIDNKPVLAIYDLQNFINGLGGVDNAAKAMKWLDEVAKENGLAGVHFQLIKYGTIEANKSGFDNSPKTYKPEELMDVLPFSSLTHYQFVHFADMNRDYNEIMKDVEAEWDDIDANFSIPYFPHISMGWDNTPRYATHTDSVVKNNTPDNIELALKKAKSYADEHNVKLITINSWNEWTETSYIQPDDLYGYGYLDKIKKVFTEE